MNDQLKTLMFRQTRISGDDLPLFGSQRALAVEMVRHVFHEKQSENVRIYVSQILSGKRPPSERFLSALRKALEARLNNNEEKVAFVMSEFSDRLPNSVTPRDSSLIHIKKLTCSLSDLQELMRSDKGLVINECIIQNARE